MHGLFGIAQCLHKITSFTNHAVTFDSLRSNTDLYITAIAISSCAFLSFYGPGYEAGKINAFSKPEPANVAGVSQSLKEKEPKQASTEDCRLGFRD
jgi:hypothetical protein